MSNYIGNYKLGRTLGCGSFCKVKLGTHTSTRKRVAIKILNKKKLRANDLEGKIETEIAILASLNHPHIIRLYEVMRTQTDIFIVMEYVARGELFDYTVSNGRLSEKEARKLFQQLIYGLDYIHSKGFVHRDLKPENLLLDEDGNLRIADFGLANIMKDGFFMKTSCGSPNYASPEVVSGEVYGGPEVDVWSAGVILYVLLTGKLPFDGENIPNTFRKIKSGKYTIPSYLTEGPTDLIHKILKVCPMERITIDGIKKHWWFKKYLPLQYEFINNKKQENVNNIIINKNIVELLSKYLSIRLFEIEEALKMGPKILYQRIDRYNKKRLTRLRYVAVCYHLVNDSQHRTKILRELTAPYHMKQNIIKKNNENTSEIIMSTPSTQRRLHKEHVLRTEEYSHSLHSSLIHGLDTMQWLIGLQITSNPQRMMKYVLESLKLIQMEWIFNSPYCIIARKVNNDELKIQIQLYLSSESYNSSNVILDIQRLCGQSFPFLSLCAKLMGTIKHLPQRFTI